MEQVSISVELTQEDALALAQFIKRTSHNDCVKIAVSEAEAYRMMDGINAVYAALREAGINPR